jgi:hypothetical protein
MDGVIVNRVGALEICCFRNADKFLRRLLIVTSLKTVSFVVIGHRPGNATFHTAVGFCVYSECVDGLLRWLLKLFIFCEAAWQ